MMTPTRRRRLDTMAVIAAYLGISQRQVRRLASPHRPPESRLPLWRMTDGPNSTLYAYVDELDAWEQRTATLGRSGAEFFSKKTG